MADLEFEVFTLQSGDIVRLMNKQSESFLTISEREIKTLIEKKYVLFIMIFNKTIEKWASNSQDNKMTTKDNK